MVLNLGPLCYLSKMACNQTLANSYVLAGLPVPYECREFAATVPDYAGPARIGAPAAGSPQEVASAIGQGIGLGLQVFSSIYGTVTGIDPATGLARTPSGQVPVSELGPTTISGPGGSTTIEAQGFFTPTNLLVVGGIGLLAVILLTGGRR